MTAAWSAFSYLLVVGAGVSVALQQVLNANLRAELGSPWWAGFVSYFVGMLAMLVVALTSPGPRLPDSFAGAAPWLSWNSWLSWTGGLFGALFIATAIFMVPRLGAATVLALIVVGQMLGSLAFDHFGLFGLAHQPVSPTRLAGAAALILGVVLIRL
ncbi:DMT family transporter [Azospirillum soli]|uniref:DMT family transporter n=1 Tax=Azospirillum soli TaxID=1304799 RepID=UPI001AE43488|nr:DMT family transporter [Azospirillum soli]MBP2312162.1 transporter family-2 protein [Azospirillum soli]